MYDYHNYLRATHPASSPWWAWPLDLKPVWFEQSDYAGGTTAVIYDTGNLVAVLAGDPGRGLGVLAGVEAAQPGPGLRGHRRHVHVAALGAHRPRHVPVPRLHRRCRSRSWPWPTSWPSCGTDRRRARGSWPRSSAGTRDHRRAAAVAVPAAAVRPRQHRSRSTRARRCAARCRATFTLTDFQVIGVAAGVRRPGRSRRARVPARCAIGGPVGGGVAPLLLPVAFAVALLGAVLVVVGAALPGTAVFQAQVTAEMPAFIALAVVVRAGLLRAPGQRPQALRRRRACARPWSGSSRSIRTSRACPCPRRCRRSTSGCCRPGTGASSSA